MIPLEIRLRALVTLKIKLIFKTFKKTLFKADLWRYQAPAINKNIFDVHTRQPDNSPPKIEEYSTPVVSYPSCLLTNEDIQFVSFAGFCSDKFTDEFQILLK